MNHHLSNRLRGEAEVSNAAPYIKELMREAADSLDSLYHVVQALASTTEAPTIESHKTNADRIRAMTDEELAKQLAGEQYVGIKTFILGLDRELLPAIEEETRKAWPEIVKEKLDWLREEVTNE